MSTNNKNNVASQALLEMDNITSAIKEESKKSLGMLLTEAVKNAIRENCNEENDDEEDDDYEVIDEKEKKEKKTNSRKSSKSNSKVDEDEDYQGMPSANQQSQQRPAQLQNSEMGNGVQSAGRQNGAVEAPVEEPEGEGEDEWEQFDDYKVGNSNTYDLSGENDYNKVAKVYKLLSDDDDVVIKNDGDSIMLQDKKAGTEYVIDLGEDDDNEDYQDESEYGEEEQQMVAESIYEDDLAGFPDDEENDFDDEDDYQDVANGSQPWDDDDYEDFDNGTMPFNFNGESSDDEENFDDEDDSYELDDEENFDDEDNSYEFDDEQNDFNDNSLYESRKKSNGHMKKETLFEIDLGYTDNYQDKDPISGLSNDEPSKSGRSWHKGVPTGTSKPWAGPSKKKGKPFGNSIDEEEMPEFNDESMNDSEIEEGVNVGGPSQRRSPKTLMPSGRKNYGPMNKRHVSSEASYEELVAEANKLKKANKQLKEAIGALKQNLNEAYITNVNLGKIAKLFLENTTSQSEKFEIVNRFSNEAKTIEQSKALYESISRELKKTNSTLNINESSVTAKGSKALNEEKIYKSNDLMKTIDLMNRIENI